MKHSFVHRTARGLIVPFVIVIGVLLAGAGSARASKKALVEVGFVGVPPPNFQNVLLNVQSVRLNPKASAAPGNGKWQTIPVPPGIGNAGQSADMQIDLNTSQNVPQLFNTANVQANTYQIAELRLDPNNPGSLIPDCPKSATLGGGNTTADGCINYPFQLATGNNPLTVPFPGGLIFPGNGALTQLIFEVSMVVNSPPTVPGGAYTVTITLASPPTNPIEMGTVTGSVNVKTGSSGSSTKIRKLAVTAEAIGTNTPIATAPVKNGNFTLILPAAGGNNASLLGFGTLYDLAVAGGTDTYAAERLLPLYPGQTITVSPAFQVTGSQTLGNITGSISDNCVAKKAIVGATLQLLIPPDSNSAADCFPTIASPDDYLQCVAVATANTDNAGNFPLPGTITIPPEFASVPVQSKSLPNKGAYVMEISAPGYDNLFVYAIPGSSKNGGTCGTDGTTFSACNLALNTGYVSGSIQVERPNPGQTTEVQVFAEDHGTNNIESALPMPVRVTNSNGGTIGYTLNVPTSATVPQGFDLFAATVDNLYQSVSDPNKGQTIAVLSDVPAPAPPSGSGICDTKTANFSGDQTITCVGHGSVTGSVANANLGTSVVLSKQDTDSGNFVAITNTPVQNQSANSNPLNSYSFCAPADIYQVQEWQLPTPDSSAAPSSSPTASPVPDIAAVVIIPTPLSAGGPNPTPTPAINCPTTCENSDGTCPGICNNVIQPLPPTPSPTPTP